jgi:endonuclease I
MCDVAVNRLRSNYNFVDWGDLERWEFDSRSHVFAPPWHAKGAIGRAVLYMYDKYDVKRFPGDDSMFLSWSCLPVHQLEWQHDILVRRITGGDGNHYVQRSLSRVPKIWI